MEIPELPRRIHTVGEEPPARHSISYHTCWALHTALKKALHDDEYEELKESKLGELTSFWGMLGFHVEAGPSTGEIIAALGRCEGWSRDDRKRLTYLAIFTGYIEGRKYSTPTRVSLARLVMELEQFENYPWGRVAFKVGVYTALPELGATYGKPLPNNPSRPILAYKGGKGRRRFKEAILDQFDVEDTPTENIIKLMFVKKPWKWTLEHWEVTGTRVNTKPAVVIPKKKNVVKEDSASPRKKARKEAPAKASEEAPAESSEEKVGITTKWKGIGTSSQNRGTGTSSQNTTSPPKNTLEPESESVNGTNAGKKRMPEDKGPDVPADDSSSKDKAPEPSLVLLAKNQSTVSDLQKDDARYQDKRDAALALYRAKSYNPFAPIDKKKLKELADWLKTCLHYRAALDKKPRTNRTWWYHILRTSLEWLEDCHIDAWINVMRKRYHAKPQHFRSKRICFVDHLFAQQWRFNFKDFKDSEPDQNGLGRRLPGGVWNYYAGTIPSFCQSNKVWGTDIDDIYAPVNYNDNHWIAMWISFPKRHIVVFDSICSSISLEELDVVMEPFLYMIPYLLVECASSDEQRVQYSLKPFTFERPNNIRPELVIVANGKTVRDKMAVDIFQELPDAHEFLNKDNDANLGAYEA
ncbi:hypothetical protein F2Q69_00029143 [Brassica cretica]|uniref:Ubiquitin-like protease family profile domain-containing protein n=1 Tax=Brassica cretica TaxID=69181 RepID=A0A8S9RX63_BRACR|nr:hypothetical protein F2Q69_00029143 [Brassica cretica]